MQTSTSLPIERERVTSPDGTTLSYIRIGSGAPLVVCHGSFATAQDWLRFGVHMAETRTVYLYDRRGHGLSTRGRAEAATDAEVDDLATMVDVAGPGSAVLGHSYGGGCTLSFAVRERFTGPVIVYEPQHAVRRPVSRGHIAAIRRLIASGDRDAAIDFILARVVCLPENAIRGFRHSALWGRMRETVDALPDELHFLDTLTWRPGDFEILATAPIILVGEENSASPDKVETLQMLLPGAHTVLVPEQGHFAYHTDPARLADIVSQCLSEHDRAF